MSSSNHQNLLAAAHFALYHHTESENQENPARAKYDGKHDADDHTYTRYGHGKHLDVKGIHSLIDLVGKHV